MSSLASGRGPRLSHLAPYFEAKGPGSAAGRCRAPPSATDWSRLDLNRISKAVLYQDRCIERGRCRVTCEGPGHRAMTAAKEGRRQFEVKTYADFEVQIDAVLGRASSAGEARAAATEHVVSLILRGCGLA